jgi:hypothetical protein
MHLEISAGIHFRNDRHEEAIMSGPLSGTAGVSLPSEEWKKKDT